MAREKRRNSEKRKEKSRDAARCRRSKETEIFTELAECLPLSENVIHQLDKASIMRLAISQLKIDDILDAVGIADSRSGHEENSNDDKLNKFEGMMVDHIKSEEMTRDLWITSRKDKMEQVLPEGHTSQLYMKALGGTVVILSSEGDFVYLSGNVAKHLGMQQIELMGQSIYDYIHPCDHDEIKNALNPKTGSGSSRDQQQHNGDSSSSSLAYSEARTFSVRMKCTLTTKGRSVNLKSAPYKVMKCSGRLVGCLDNHAATTASFKPYLLAMMEPIPHPANIEVPLDSSTFLTKHEMDMSFIFCDERIEDLAGYDPNAMLGRSFFDFHHGLDSEVINKTFKDLYSKGQAMTSAYRMLVANGGYIWLVTQATTINNSRTQKPQSVVCIHYVLSGVEERGLILSNIQEDLAMPIADDTDTAPPTPATTPSLPTLHTKTEMHSPAPMTFSPLTPTTPSTPLMADDRLDGQEQQKQQQQLDFIPPKLELSTESIFAPKTKSMEMALCRPPDLVPYLTDDLACLSPMAGDDMMLLPFTNTHNNNNNKTTNGCNFLSPPMLPMAKSPSEVMRQNGLTSPGQFSGGSMTSDDCFRPSSPDYLNCVLPLELDPIEKFFVHSETSPLGNENTTPIPRTSQDNDMGMSHAQQQHHQQQLKQQSMSGGDSLVLTKEELVVDNLRDEDMMDIDFAMRAPYIPMDGEQDLGLLPPSNAALFNLSKEDINPSVFGRTEFVFGPKEMLFEEPSPTPKRSLRDMLGESTAVASIEQPPETKYLQMKRSLDMNCLEKGPPAPKMGRVEESACSMSSSPVRLCQNTNVNASNAIGSKNSVLLNLLLTGEDISYGYKVSQKPFENTGIAKTNLKLKGTISFETLTIQDCEVNAPVQSCKFLQGQELVDALGD